MVEIHDDTACNKAAMPDVDRDAPWSRPLCPPAWGWVSALERCPPSSLISRDRTWCQAETGACGTLPSLSPEPCHLQTLYLGGSFPVWMSKGQSEHLESASWTVFALEPAVNSFILTVRPFFSALLQCVGSRKKEIPGAPGSWRRPVGLGCSSLGAGPTL